MYIGVEMMNKVVIVSDEQQRDSAYIYMYPFSPNFPPI